MELFTEQRTEGVERWIDEAFSEFGDAQAIKLAAAGAIVNQLRAEIYETTKFRCSAGISYNKVGSMLYSCGLTFRLDVRVKMKRCQIFYHTFIFDGSPSRIAVPPKSDPISGDVKKGRNNFLFRLR